MKAIIMAGGSGTRLWPLSRLKYPKQFLKLKDMDKSFFQMTIERCLMFCGLKDIYVLTVKDYEFIIQSQIEEMGFGRDAVRVLLEPQAKNTLPAIYNGVKAIREECGDDTAVVFTSDHLIGKQENLIAQIKAGAPHTKQYIYAFGIKPKNPETGYGYVMPGEAIEVGYKIGQFKEKPDYETAKTYVANGYFWNSGMFMLDTGLFEEEVKRLAPEVHAAFQLPTVEERFENTPKISIDYGIMEKSDCTAVLPLDIEWDDIGSFATFYETYESHKDDNGNVSFQDDIMINSSGNLTYMEDGKICALIGVNDLVVVDQGDALLICDKNATQDVKGVYDRLKARGDSRADTHLTEFTPWGHFTILENGEFYKIRRLSVFSGKQMGYQMHYHRSEHWIIVKGTATVTVNGEEYLAHSGENVFIKAGDKHSIRNDGRLLLEVLEVQSGQYLGEDDVVDFDTEAGK